MPPKQLYTKFDIARDCVEPEKIGDIRPEFRRDYARLVHSVSFRRLVGKTQLFPGKESDFFRNRLTHSHEVAQIAKSIAYNANHKHPYFKVHNLDYDLVEFAALAHDLGHSPFGHIGEDALDEEMKLHGGFEGNAHTLRLLSVIEKKVKGVGSDNQGFIGTIDKRLGLNLTYRSLAAILKYDEIIPLKRPKRKEVFKGYYDSEKGLVKRIKEHVTGIKGYSKKIKTVECAIMDIADDIAYSTFDLEDTLKANFITPLDFIAVNEKVLSQTLKKVNKKSGLGTKDEKDIIDTLRKIISVIIFDHINLNNSNANSEEGLTEVLAKVFENTKLIDSGYIRCAFSSHLISTFISGISIELNEEIPSLSEVKVDPEVKLQIEVLKYFIFYSITMSPRLRLPEFRGHEIVSDTFSILSKSKGDLLANDYKEIYANVAKPERKRVLCDFIAGMTDRYAIEFHGRLKSENPQTIFKPL